MTVLRPLLLLCLAACTAAGAHAGAQDRARVVNEEESAAPIAPAPGPSRFSREGYRPSTPAAPNTAPTPQRYDPRAQRLETLRNRYQMPREMSQEMHQAIREAQRTHGGKILSADRMRSDGRDVYRVKLLTRSGRVRVVQMPENDATPEARGQQGEK